MSNVTRMNEPDGTLLTLSEVDKRNQTNRVASIAEAAIAIMQQDKTMESIVGDRSWGDMSDADIASRVAYMIRGEFA